MLAHVALSLTRRGATLAAALAIAASAWAGTPPAHARAPSMTPVLIEPAAMGAGASLSMSATGSPRMSKREAAVLRLTNKARSHSRMCGTTRMQAAPPLRWNRKLARSAYRHSADMATRDYFSHNALSGLSPFDRIRATGYTYRVAGENIAAGQSLVTARAVVRAWLDSPSHCRNLMLPGYRHLGVGRSRGPGSWGIYWTQNFGRRSST